MTSPVHILDARAARLACRHDADEFASEFAIKESHLLFDVAGQDFAMRAALAVEVIRDPIITPLPAGPRGLAGVFAVRGVIRAAIDVGCLQNDVARLPKAPAPGALTRKFAVLFRCGEREAGLLADEVTGLDRLAAFDPAGLDGPGWRLRPFIEGVTAKGRIVLDAGALERYIFHEACD